MKQTDRVPHKARGAAQSAGVPAESAGTTKTSYPLMKYLSLLLAVALLFSGVTFARYLSNDRIDASVGIAAFDATYSIDRVNSTTFGNQSYWIDVGGTWVPQGAGTAITVGITLKNNGDTSVMPTLHFEGPKEYWDNIALQLTTADENFATGNFLTPQLVIGDITDAEGNSFHTSTSKDYGSLGGDDAELSLSDSVVDRNDVRTATWTYGEGENAKMNKMTITKKTDAIITYSVGFVRESGDTLLPPIFVDCQKKTAVYSIDFELPALDLGAAEDGEKKPSEQRVIVWLTWTTALANTSVSADRAFWGFEGATSTGESNLDNMQGDKQFSFTNQYVNGSKVESGGEITVLGYHFDQSGVPVVNKSGAATGETTTVRVKKTFASEDEDGTGTIEYFHVASINDTDGSYVHGLTRVEEVEGMIYKCANKVAGNQIWVNLQGVSANLDISSITMIENTIEIEGTEQKVVYAPIQQRAFGVSFRATFVQWSEVPAI